LVIRWSEFQLLQILHAHSEILLYLTNKRVDYIMGCKRGAFESKDPVVYRMTNLHSLHSMLAWHHGTMAIFNQICLPDCVVGGNHGL
jgi:hypothetical protein